MYTGLQLVGQFKFLKSILMMLIFAADYEQHIIQEWGNPLCCGAARAMSKESHVVATVLGILLVTAQK